MRAGTNHMAQLNAVRPSFTISGIMIDQERLKSFPVTISDFTRTGCRVAFNGPLALPDSVAIATNASEDLIPGRIVEQTSDTARIEFVWEQLRKEKRREPRRDVMINAFVSDGTPETKLKGLITNASKSGCRIDGAGLERLPDEISISIPSLDRLVPGRIVWRQRATIGVELVWRYASRAAVAY